MNKLKRLCIILLTAVLICAMVWGCNANPADESSDIRIGYETEITTESERQSVEYSTKNEAEEEQSGSLENIPFEVQIKELSGKGTESGKLETELEITEE